MDRRRLVRRMTKLEAELKELTKNRRIQRKGRARSRLSTVSLVGYTNAGKSTLLNRLTDAGVLVEDRLFATLDPRTRRLELPGGEAVLLSDTVGLRPQAAPPAGRGVPLDPRGGEGVGSARPRGRFLRPSRPRPRSRPCGRCWPRSGPTRCPSCWPSTRPTWLREAERLAAPLPGFGHTLGLDGRGHRRVAAGHRGPAPGAGRGGRARRALSTAATSWPRSTGRERSWWRATATAAVRLRVRVDQAGAARFREFLADGSTNGAGAGGPHGRLEPRRPGMTGRRVHPAALSLRSARRRQGQGQAPRWDRRPVHRHTRPIRRPRP